MIVNYQVSLPGPIDSVAFSPGGDRAVVAVGGDRLMRFDLSDGLLKPQGVIAAPTDRYHAPWVKDVTIRETRAAFLDEGAVLLARSFYRSSSDRSIPMEETYRTSLLAFDAETGDVRGEFQAHASGIGFEPIPTSSRHVLLGLHQKTVVCVDTSSWREVCRLRDLDESGDPIGDDAFCPEESITANGVAYAPGLGLLYVLWGYAFGSALQTYRFDPDGPRFVSLRRTPEFDREPYALCARPGGADVAVLLSDTGKIVPYGREPHLIPRRSLLGPIGMTFGDEMRFLDVESDTERDFACWKQLALDPFGQQVVSGYTVFVESGYEPRMISLDDTRIVLGSPKGYLLRFDTDTGRAEPIHDFLSPVKCLAFHPGTRRLLAGCKDTTLSLLTD